MIRSLDDKSPYLEAFDRLEAGAGRPGPAWLQEVRGAAINCFHELGFPTDRDEAWRFTNIGPLARTSFRLAGAPARGGTDAAPAGIDAAQLERLTFPRAGCHQLVFIDGWFAPGLSAVGALPPGTVAGSLAALLREGPEELEPHLTRYADWTKHAFAALNTAFIADGAAILIPDGAAVSEPIHVLFVSTAREANAVSHPRSVIVAGRRSEATVIESYVAAGRSSPGGVYWTNAVTEVAAAEGSALEHVRIQSESPQAFHTASTAVRLGRDAVYASHALAFGAALARHDLGALLDGEGIDCVLNGLYIGHGRQHLDNHTRIEHARPHSGSRELYKGILDGAASAVFNGRIHVRREAQKTDAKQSNKNLLLSTDALVNTNPELEIFADDVKCTHGATIGHLDAGALFYLRSRGIDAAAARRILTHGFASEVLGRIKAAPVREALERRLFPDMAAGEARE